MVKKKIIAGGGLVLNDSGELLMIFRRGKWDLPKGKLDEGETIEACALREVAEETGATNLELGALIDIGYHEYFDRFLQEEVLKETHWFSMRAKGGQNLVPQTEEDILEIQWVKGESLAACLQNTYDNVTDVISKAGLL
ncbi:MAG: NUDIX domain-containing protein [Bacteroidetes bacterium]|nr:NUDIX domain-containing protein [Bacteroidota bacterium]